jgi:pilus assembly protein Flp/PilA
MHMTTSDPADSAKGGEPMLHGLLMRLHSLRNETGATAVEYGLMVALIAAVIIAAVQLLGFRLDIIFDTVANAVGTATP